MALKPIKVSQLNSYIKRIINTDPILGNASVIGEISNLKYHSSGHVYFSLKDENSSVRCFIPNSNVTKLRYRLTEGMEIIAIGYVSVYERGGYYSLNIKDIQVNGEGSLSIAFNELKARLQLEGLFDPIYKKQIPQYPQKIALVTSETGAAVQDMIKIIKSRNNMVDVLIYSVLVQGNDAATSIAGAIDDINNNIKDVAIIIVGRGGGSKEELWAFNEEIVARSIFASEIPIISAVGHEIDFSISDFVSDLRAETPTAAAALAVPDLYELKKQLLQTKEIMRKKLINKVENLENIIKLKKQRLESNNPRNIIAKGYGAIVNENGDLILTVDDVKVNDKIKIILKDGEISTSIENIKRGRI